MKELWANLSANTLYNELKDSDMSSDDICKHIVTYVKFNKEEGLEANILANTLCCLTSHGIKIYETLHGYIAGGSLYSFMTAICGDLVHSPYTLNIVSELRKYGKILKDTKLVNELLVIDSRNLVSYPYNEAIEIYSNDIITILHDNMNHIQAIKENYNVDDSIYQKAYVSYCACINEIDVTKMFSNGINVSRINVKDLKSQIKDIVSLHLEQSIENNKHIPLFQDKVIFEGIVLDLINSDTYDPSNYLITDTVENILNYDINTPYIIELKRYITNKLEGKHDTSTIYAYENKYMSDSDLTEWKKAYGEDSDINDEDLIKRETESFDPNYKFEE